MSSIIGQNLKVSIFGQSHSKAIGVTIDGLEAGKKIDMDKLNAFLSKRAPGKNEFSTKRNEGDIPEFISGLVEDTTCGAPLTALIYNNDTRSGDYKNIVDIPRPAHADLTAQIKYSGFQDVRGGGHFSGRLTAPLCVAGGICIQILEEQDIKIAAYIKRIGNAYDETETDEQTAISAFNKNFPCVDDKIAEEMKNEILNAKNQGDSIGGVIECKIFGMPSGVGNPMFDGVENRISQAVFGIPAVKGIEFGSGFESAKMLGSQNNDEFYFEGDTVKTKTNNHGGILGGITSGMPIVFRVAIKPTPSIAKEQNSVSLSKGENTKLNIVGRHDPCIVQRAVPCVASAAAIAIYDMLKGEN